IEFDNPSLAHGAKEAIIGKIKETIGKITRKDYLRESGRDQKIWGKREFKAAKKAEGAANFNRKPSI
ncbi:4657_t:CDS:2, partial [Dentiscutata erythropus]